MSHPLALATLALAGAVALAACGSQETAPSNAAPAGPADGAAAPAAPTPPPATPAAPAAPAAPTAPAKEPERVTVDHILVMARNPRAPEITRSVEDARKLAGEILEQLRKDPSQWNALKQKHSEDPPNPGAPKGGPYMLANTGVSPVRPEFPRHGMVKGFGDGAFRLAVDEMGMVDFDPQASPFGFHILKRLR